MHSTVGGLLAGRLGRRFVDADNFHTPENIGEGSWRCWHHSQYIMHAGTPEGACMRSAAKMRAGLPLTDADRAPWLRRLAGIIDEDLSAGRCLVLACSALKEAYRGILRAGHGAKILFVSLPLFSFKHLLDMQLRRR
jgi:gluconokinase